MNSPNTAQSLPSQPQASASVLRRLRTLTPSRDSITFGEALHVAERQAADLCRLLDPTGEGLTERHLAELPRIVVHHQPLPVSGLSHWDGSNWVIRLNVSDSLARQRFTLLHEFKHVIDHGHAQRLYRGRAPRSPEEQTELAADYFAGCALVSKRDLKRAWGNGLQRPAVLAEHFCVSEPAIRVRLSQTGLDRVTDQQTSSRCARPVYTPPEQRQRFRSVPPIESRAS